MELLNVLFRNIHHEVRMGAGGRAPRRQGRQVGRQVGKVLDARVRNLGFV